MSHCDVTSKSPTAPARTEWRGSDVTALVVGMALLTSAPDTDAAKVSAKQKRMRIKQETSCCHRSPCLSMPAAR